MMRWLTLVLVLGACGGGRSLKQAGEQCTSSVECGPGLLCDLGQSPAVCAGNGSLDAFVPPPDSSGPGIDAGVDAPPVDAPVDAAIDAMIDAM